MFIRYGEAVPIDNTVLPFLVAQSLELRRSSCLVGAIGDAKCQH